MCVGVSVWLGWGGIRVAGFSLWCVMPWLLVVGGQEPAALHLTTDHQQPRLYTPYEVKTQI